MAGGYSTGTMLALLCPCARDGSADLLPTFQIIARIQTPSVHIRRTINMLLTDVGKHHPQALIYPLTVASKSSSAARKNAALAIMDRMREHSATIVEQVWR